MTANERDYAVLINCINTISVTCAGSPEKIVDLLTGYLWDEEEAGEIKESTGKNKF